MLELSLTRIRHSKDMPVLPGVVVHEEGVPLVQAMFDGKETAAVSGQDGAKIFLGFSYSETMRPVTKANITTVTPTANNLTFTLPGGFEPLTGQILVAYADTHEAFTSSASPSAKQYKLEGAVITFAAADAGKAIEIQYRYTPSQQDLLFNDRVPYTFSTAPEMYGRIGCILEGDVYTDQYDASINWAAPTASHVLTAGANGRVTMAAAGGVEIPGYVISIPNESNPYLGIRLK